MNLPRLRAASDELLHLDLMRFVASVGIVVHHSIEYFLPLSQRSNLPSYGLSLFVDLFFVISGFVIAHVYHDRVSNAEGYAKFLQRRVGRLVPLHWLTLMIWAALWGAIAWAGIRAAHFPGLSLSCVADTAFLLHAVIHCGTGAYLNSVTWSISTEMMMYLMFPIIAGIALRRRPLLLLLFLLSIAIATVTTISNGYAPSGFYTYLPPLLRAVPSFLFGTIMFFYKEKIVRLPLPYAALPIAVVAMIATMVTAAPQLITLLLVYLVALSAVVLDGRGDIPSAVRKFAPLGQLTYSIYMWHLLFILALMHAIGDKLLHGRWVVPLAVLTYVSIAIMSYISYFFIETPARRWVDGLDIAKIGNHFRRFSRLQFTDDSQAE